MNVSHHAIQRVDERLGFRMSHKKAKKVWWNITRGCCRRWAGQRGTCINYDMDLDGVAVTVVVDVWLRKIVTIWRRD